MSELSSQQEHEIGFWISHSSQYGENYRAARIAEYKDKTQRFEPWWSEQKGNGIDVGCGCVSVLEGCGKHFFALDPLVDEYAKFCEPMRSPLYFRMSAEALPADFAESYDWLFCVNMLDHTPNPAKAVSEMRRVLKPGGRLYFEVNFDDDAAPAHYGLWTLGTVERYFPADNAWFRRMYTVERHHEGNQWRYWAIYEKR